LRQLSEILSTVFNADKCLIGEKTLRADCSCLFYTVRVWAERVGTSQQAVVIGPTSAKACRSAGWEEDCIACPEGSKGIEAWASLTLKAAAEGLVAKNSF
jgi:hypothetical protein